MTWLWIVLGLGISCCLGFIFVLTLVVYFWVSQNEAMLPVGITSSRPDSTSPAPETDLVSEGTFSNPSSDLPSTTGRVAAAADSSRPLLEYRWDPDILYTWKFDIKVKSGGELRTHIGKSSFRARVEQASRSEKHKQSASGTGFVVHESGFLVTCAHVVDKATKVSVRLGSRSFPAEVIASDARNDLALLKISANNLPALNLTEVDSVALGAEVRSIGYPLTDLLGNSVKITRGTLSGFVAKEGRELLQIDAAINPGNSGGPVIDASGNVIGVASEKISGQGISNIGFCVPVGIVNQFLKQQSVQPRTQARKKDSAQSQLNNIIPAVALVEVELGAGKRYEMVDFSEFDRTSDPSFRLQFLRQQLDRGQLLVGVDGSLQEYQGAVESPSLLGPLAALPLVPLPQPWQSTWGNTNEIELKLVVGEQYQDPIRSLFPQPFSRNRFGMGPQYEVKSIPAIQSEQLKIVRTEGDVVSIERENVIVTKSDIQIEHRMNWRYDFDSKKALVLQADGEGTFVVDDEQISTMQVELSYRPELEVRVNSNPSRPSPEAKLPAEVPATKSGIEMPEDLQAALAQLAKAQTLPGERVEQLKLLTEMATTSRFRQKVVEQILGELDRKEDEVVLAAVKALNHWDTATKTEQVMPLLKHPAAEVRLASVEYFGAMQDGSVTPALYEALEQKDLRDSIYAAMRNIGPTGEKGVLKMLSHPEEVIRIEGCLILEEIGSERSELELKRLAGGEGKDSQQAQRTLAKLGLSQKSEPAQNNESDEVNPFETKKKSRGQK